MFSDAEFSAEKEPLPLDDSEIHDLLWNAAELKQRLTSLCESKLVSALAYLLPNRQEISGEQFRRFEQFVFRFRSSLERLFGKVDGVFKAPKIEPEDIAIQILEGMRALRTEMQQCVADARKKGNGSVLEAIERGVRALEHPFELNDLKEEKVLETMDAVPPGVELNPNVFFTEKIKPEAVPSLHFNDSNPADAWAKALESTERRETEEVPPFRWSWTDDELFEKKKLPAFRKLRLSGEQIRNLWAETAKELVAGFDEWAKKCRTILADAVLGDARGRQRSIDEVLATLRADHNKHLVETTDIIFNTISSASQAEIDGFSRELIEAERSLCKISGGPEAGFVEPVIGRFLDRMLESDVVGYPLLDDRHVDRKQELYSCELSKTNTSADDWVKLGKGIGWHDPITQGEVNEAVVSRMGFVLDGLGPNRGNTIFEIQNALTTLRKRFDAEVKPQVEALAGREFTYVELIRFWKDPLRQHLEIVNNWSHAGLPGALILDLKNQVSFFVCWNARDAVMRGGLVSGLPISSEYLAELSDFYPKRPEAERPTGFRCNWTDEQLFEKDKLMQMRQITKSREEIIKLFEVMKLALKYEYSEWKKTCLKTLPDSGFKGKKKRFSSLRETLDYMEDAFSTFLNKEFGEAIFQCFDDPYLYHESVSNLEKQLVIKIRSYCDLAGGPEPEFVEKILKDFFGEWRESKEVPYHVASRNCASSSLVVYLTQPYESDPSLDTNVFRTAILSGYSWGQDLEERVFNDLKPLLEVSVNRQRDVSIVSECLKTLSKKLASVDQIPSVVYSTAAEYVYVLQQVLRFALKTIGNFEFPGLDRAFLMELKNKTSFHVSWNIRDMVLRFPHSQNWPLDEEYDTALRNFFPSSPEELDIVEETESKEGKVSVLSAQFISLWWGQVWSDFCKRFSYKDVPARFRANRALEHRLAFVDRQMKETIAQVDRNHSLDTVSGFEVFNQGQRQTLVNPGIWPEEVQVSEVSFPFPREECARYFDAQLNEFAGNMRTRVEEVEFNANQQELLSVEPQVGRIISETRTKLEEFRKAISPVTSPAADEIVDSGDEEYAREVAGLAAVVLSKIPDADFSAASEDADPLDKIGVVIEKVGLGVSNKEGKLLVACKAKAELVRLQRLGQTADDRRIELEKIVADCGAADTLQGLKELQARIRDVCKILDNSFIP